ncbi:two-component sensor histidine kinase [Plantactinospora sp. S1510]|uniref:histidine kinase n=1 Tax=Plantactinospora alkalitolerans TaxID=2789879 RepID=A0ABS0GYR1_9ACTN|nr:two-component sensor histidine kinase [Plantactinospora alkalitolerans]
MRWLTRIFDDRYAWLRLTLLGLSGVGYLLVGHDSEDAPHAVLDWLAVGAALALCPVAVRWPFAGLLTASLVFGLAGSLGQADPVVPEVGATWMMLELALRAPTRQLGVGVAALVAAQLTDLVERLPSGLPGWLYDMAVTVGVPLLIGLNIRASRQLARQADQRVAVEARAARTGERAAIARELHDLVAHHVASMVLRVGVARHVLRDTDSRVTEVFDDLHDSGTSALADLRRLVSVLRNPAMVADGPAYVPIEPGALPDALATTVDRAVKTGLTVDATIDPAVATLDTVRGLAVLRLTQEGLANVAKHAGPTARARLCVRMVDGAVHWEITDDGGAYGADGGTAARRGADGGPGTRRADRRADRRAELGASDTGPGHGLTGMRERVEVLGGRLAAGPADDGWRLQTVLPAGVGG